MVAWHGMEWLGGGTAGHWPVNYTLPACLPACGAVPCVPPGLCEVAGGPHAALPPCLPAWVPRPAGCPYLPPPPSTSSHPRLGCLLLPRPPSLPQVRGDRQGHVPGTRVQRGVQVGGPALPRPRRRRLCPCCPPLVPQHVHGRCGPRIIRMLPPPPPVCRPLPNPCPAACTPPLSALSALAAWPSCPSRTPTPAALPCPGWLRAASTSASRASATGWRRDSTSRQGHPEPSTLHSGAQELRARGRLRGRWRQAEGFEARRGRVQGAGCAGTCSSPAPAPARASTA